MAENLDKALELLLTYQEADGEFKTFESNSFSEVWAYKSPSPFVTANVLLSLKNIRHGVATDIWKRGSTFLESQMEFGGFWRFWKLNAQQHNVPIDSDDTALCAYILIRNGEQLTKTQKVLSSLYIGEGLFRTWILHSKALIRFPLLLLRLKADYKNFAETIALKMFAPDDYEPAVSANVLLLLNEDKMMEAACEYLVKTLSAGSPLPMQFYNHELVTLYHYSRMLAYNGKVNEKVRTAISDRVKSLVRDKPVDDVLFILLLNVLLLIEDRSATSIEHLQRFHAITLDKLKEQHFPYFNSKDMVFRAGSPALNIAWYIQCLESLNSF